MPGVIVPKNVTKTVSFVKGALPAHGVRVQRVSVEVDLEDHEDQDHRVSRSLRHLRNIADIAASAGQGVPHTALYSHGGGVGQAAQTYSLAMQHARRALTSDLGSVTNIAFFCFVAWKTYTHGQRLAGPDVNELRRRSIVTSQIDLAHRLSAQKLQHQGAKSLCIILFSWVYLPALRRCVYVFVCPSCSLSYTPTLTKPPNLLTS